MPTWILVADNSRARIFSADKPAGPIMEINTLTFPEGRLHAGDLTTDKGGRGQSPGARSHGVNGEEAYKQDNADRFAALICHELDEARGKGLFKRLYIVAAPALLGLLRKHQTPALRQLVADELDKNLTTQSPEVIRKHLPDFI